jgi:chlorobactene glucosyltransferase
MLSYQIIVTLMLLFFLVQVAVNLRDYARLRPVAAPPRPAERLCVLIPARNEAENIEDCLNGLLAQTWDRFTLLVLDDGSDDGTDKIIAEVAARDGRVQPLNGRAIEPGWAGKVWACRQLGEAALEQGADWLLFLDADTRAQPELVGAALAYAQETNAGMVSTFPYQVTSTFWERVVLPMLHFLIVTFLPVRLVWELPFPQLVAACGQFELFSADAYRAVGGHGSIPKSFHDGLQLARRVKASGGKVRLCDGSEFISCRMYAGGQAVWNGFTRNAYEGLGSPVALVVMTLLQTVLFLMPYLFLLYVFCDIFVLALLRGIGLHLWPVWGWLCLVQVGLILLMRLLQTRRFGHYDSLLLHPLSIVALVSIQWASWWKTLRKSHVAWKGRTYAQAPGDPV